MKVTTLFVYYFGLCLLFKTGILSFRIGDIQTSCNHFKQKAVVAEWLNGGAD